MAVQTSAARREEIQKRLQLLRDEGEREQRAFDELAAAHPDLSVAELKELAQEQAKAGEPTTLEVAGATVCVNDYVGTIDDPVLLAAVERGLPVRDPVKRVYLGERGKVLRVIPSFQGKPAVELRFADGAEKIFFAQCLDVGEQSIKTKQQRTGPSTRATSGSRAGGRGRESGAAESQPKAEEAGEKVGPAPLPAWGELSMPRRGTRHAAQSPAAPVSALIPPPPAVPPPQAMSGGSSPQASSKASGDGGGVRDRERAPTAGPGTSPSGDTPAKPPATLKQPPPKVREEAADKVAPPKPPGGGSSATPPLPPPQHPEQQSHRPIGLVKEALSDPPSRTTTPGVEELGRPSHDVFDVAERLRKGTPDLDDLAKTPRADFLEVWPLPQRVAPCPEEESQIPRRCPRDYKAKFSMGDKASHIPSYASTKPAEARHCWVAGVTEEGPVGPLAFKAMTLRPEDVSSIEAVLAAVSRELSWDRSTSQRARRVFREDGEEITTPGAIADGLRMVATRGSAYGDKQTASSRAGDAGRSAPSPPPPLPSALPVPVQVPASAEARPNSPAPRRPTTTGGKSAGPATAGNGPRTVSKDPPPPATLTKRAAPRQVKSTKSPRAGATAALSDRVGGTGPTAASEAGGSSNLPKRAAAPRSGVIHIRVYENGIYDADKYERVHRTVTIRPTYKTLSSVKVLITRELEWRDGRKVDMLFDATGMEITELQQLADNACVVASAGDRFIVPYPNSTLHREAMKLSQLP